MKPTGNYKTCPDCRQPVATYTNRLGVEMFSTHNVPSQEGDWNEEAYWRTRDQSPSQRAVDRRCLSSNQPV